MMSWGARLLYAGPAIDLSWHANGVGEFSIALDGELEVQREDGRSLIARSVFVPAGARHLMTFKGRRIGCLYVDVSAADGARLVSEMTDCGGGFATSHRHEARIASVVEDVLADRIPVERKRVVAETFGLAPLTTVSAKMAAALRILHEAPDLPHRAADLAGQVGLTETQFRKAFRLATGVPLKRYRVWVRLTAAMQAARDGENLTVCAHASGFSSSAHLSIAYRDMFGMTPSGFLAVLQRAERGELIGPASQTHEFADV